MVTNRRKFMTGAAALPSFTVVSRLRAGAPVIRLSKLVGASNYPRLAPLA
jgi:hypothetical protein